MSSRTRLITIAGVAVLAMAFAQPVRADIILTAGNTGSLEDENVLFPDQDVVGNPIFGETQTSNITVQFESDEDLVAPSGGQARVEAADGAFQALAVTIPGGSFTSLILNLNTDNGPASSTNTGTVDFLAFDTDGDEFSFENQAIGAGENFYTFTTANGQRIAAIVLFADVPLEFIDARQVRIGGAEADGVAEPASLLLIGTALAGFARWRRRVA